MAEKSSDEEDVDSALEELLADTQDPMNQKGAPKPIVSKDAIDDEPLTPFKKPTVLPAAPIAKSPNEIKDLTSKLFVNAMKIVERSQDRSEEDRSEVQVVIDHLMGKMLDGPSISSVEVESLVLALRVKTDATANMAKFGDMIARLVSSSKGQEGEKTSAFDVEELSAALNVPDFHDNIRELEPKDAPKATTPEEPK